MQRSSKHNAKPAGGRDRRGSILVLSLGVLVLMATLVLVFGGVAATDRRLGEGIEASREPDRVARQVAEYIARIVADDVLDREVRAIGVSQIGGAIVPRFGHAAEAWDHPSTSRFMFSSPDAVADGVVRNNPEAYRFNPSGGTGPLLTALGIAAGTAAEDEAQRPRRGSDPWLASDLPVDLAPDFSGLNFDDFRARRDYVQLTNIAPDGRAVNLFNLRNNFNVENGPAGLSQFLTLMPGDNDLPTANAASTGQRRVDGLDADPNRPADWFSFQRDVAYPLNRFAVGWDDPRRFEYQFADADGDGIADSRWVELVDRTDLGAPGRPVIDSSGTFRFFVAAKAIDLSGRVNVNTATDGYLAPTDTSLPGFAYRLGASPAEIDLLRILSGTDAAADTGGLFYNALPQPPSGNDLGNYTDYGDPDFRLVVGDTAYDYLKFSQASGTLVPGSVAEAHNDLQDLDRWVVENDVNLSARISPTVFLAGIGNGADFKVSPDERVRFWALSDADGYSSFRQNLVAGNPSGFYSQTASFGNDSLLELLTRNGVNDPAVLSPLEATVSGRVAIGGDDLRLSPLRSSRPLSVEVLRDMNAAPVAFATDIRRLVTTISGVRPLASGALRDENAGVNEPDRLPVRNIRLPQKNIGGTTLDEQIEVWEQRVPLSALAQSYTGAATQAEQARAERSRFWRTANVVFDALAPLQGDGSELAWDIDAYPELLTAFYGYRGPAFAYRTAGHLVLNWLESIEPGGAAPSSFADDIRGMTLLMDNAAAYRTAFETAPWSFFQSTSPVQWAVDPSRDIAVSPDDALTSAPGTAIDRLLLPERGNVDLRIGDASDGRPAQDPVVNLYAITPQPVIIEGASMVVNADTPQVGGGDSDHVQNPANPTGPGLEFATIDYQTHVDNHDFLFSLVAFQIYNPFDTAIPLGRPGATDSGFYLEFQGRFYPLFGKKFNAASATGIELMGDEEELGPGESLTIVIASQDLPVIEDRLRRFNAAIGAAQGTGGPAIGRVADATGVPLDLSAASLDGIDDLIETHFAPGRDSGRVIVVAPFDPTGGITETSVDWSQAVAETHFDDDLDGGRLSGDIFIDGANGDDEVRLWRVNPSDTTMRDDVLVDRLRTLQLVSGINYRGRVDRHGLDRATRAGGRRLPGSDDDTDNPNDSNSSRLAGVAMLTGPYTARHDPVPNATTYAENVNLADNFNYGGLTFVGFASIRRYDELDDGSGNPVPSSVSNFDAWPAFAIEPRVLTEVDGTNVDPLDQSGSAPLVDDVRRFPWNRFDSDDPTELSRRARDNDVGEFVDGNPFYRDFDEFIDDFDATTGPDFARIIKLDVAPRSIAGGVREDIEDAFHLLGMPWGTQRVEMPPLTRTPALLRVGDLVSTLAIGPSYSPFRERDGRVSQSPTDEFNQSSPRIRAELLRARWVTLPEAMAYALDYASQEWQPGDPESKDWTQPFAGIGRKPFFPDNRATSVENPLDAPQDASLDGLFRRDDPTDRSRVLGALDGGYLVLDNFVPFIDGNPGTPRLEFPAPFTPFDAGGDVEDIPLGLGVPMALGILDRVAPVSVVASAVTAFDDPSTPVNESVVRLFPATNAVPGVVNVNTAPTNVLRAVPMLTPTFEHDLITAGPTWGQPRWIYNAGTSDEEASQDLAASIAAYRDLRAVAPLRFYNDPFIPGGVTPVPGSNNPALVDFQIDDPFNLLDPLESLGVRSFSTLVPGLRADGVDRFTSDDVGVPIAAETPGIRTPSELLAIRLRNELLADQTAGGGDDPLFASRNRFDRLGWDGDSIDNNAGTVGVSRLDSVDDAGNLADEFGERFAVFNASAASLDVRSDVFAVWFVLHGYSAADVAVGPDDPLLPSVRKRYLLVLDRSNVRRAGDEPRVVMFEELPADAN